MGYIVEKIQKKIDLQILLSIWKESFTDLDMRRICWSYEQNSDGRVRLWLLKDQSRQQYIGMCSIFPRHFQFNGKSLNGGITADLAVKRQYRSLGQALKLTRAMLASNEFDILFGMPNEKSLGVQLRAGFKELGNTSRFIKIFRTKDILKVYFHPLLYSTWPMTDIFLKLKTTRLKFKSYNYCKVDHIFDETVDLFCEKYNCMLPFFSGKRDGLYLRYRFEKNPYKEHQIFRLLEKDLKQLRGYIVFHVKDNIVKIDDFCVNDLSKSLKELLDSFTIYCIKNKYAAISLSMLSNKSFNKILKKLGFFQMNSKQKILYYSWTDEIVDGSEFILTSADFDW